MRPLGGRILGGSALPLLKLAAEIAQSHHEKWDGAGYPYGLRQTEIPLSGRIVAVADVFDALLSERPYKRGWSLEHVADHMARRPASISIRISSGDAERPRRLFAIWCEHRGSGSAGVGGLLECGRPLVGAVKGQGLGPIGAG